MSVWCSCECVRELNFCVLQLFNIEITRFQHGMRDLSVKTIVQAENTYQIMKTNTIPASTVPFPFSHFGLPFGMIFGVRQTDNCQIIRCKRCMICDTKYICSMFSVLQVVILSCKHDRLSVCSLVRYFRFANERMSVRARAHSSFQNTHFQLSPGENNLSTISI